MAIQDHSPDTREDVLRLRQRSMWNGFTYQFVDSSGRVVGGMRLPNFSQAKNARLAVHPPGSHEGAVKIDLRGDQLLLKHEYLKRGFLNNLRYTLETPAGEILCSADIVYEAKRRLPALRLTEPVQAEVMPSKSVWKKRYPIVAASGAWVGEVYEPRAVTLRFEYVIRLPATSAPVKAFVLAVAFLVRH